MRARHRAETLIGRTWLRYRVAALAALIAMTFIAASGVLVSYFEAGSEMPSPTGAVYDGPSISARDDPSSAPGPPK